MSKIRMAAEIIALAAAVIGLTSAYIQHQKVQETKAALTSAQNQLQAAASGGKLDLEIINSVIVNLSELSGKPAAPIKQAGSGQPTAAIDGKDERDSGGSNPSQAVALTDSRPREMPKPTRLRLEEGVPTDLFEEGAMYTLASVYDGEARLRNSRNNSLYFKLGERKKIPETNCEIDLIETHEDKTSSEKGWAEFRAWCP